MNDLRVFRAYFINPDGEEFDVSNRFNLSNLGAISFAIESDLTILSHGEMSVALNNNDGAVEDFFRGAAPDDAYEFILERQQRNGSEFDRLFGGILDLPTSISYDDLTREANVVIYSYSKLLDRGHGNNVKRSVVDKTASITAGLFTITMDSGGVSDILVGDVLHVNDGQGNTQDFTVDIVTATGAITVESSQFTFVKASCLIATPFYRDQTPSFILTAITTESAMAPDDRITGRKLSKYPVATPVSRIGLSLTRSPASVVPNGADVVATFRSADAANRYHSAGPSLPWTSGATSNIPQGDWTPYLDAEPGTILEHLASGDVSLTGGDTDQGIQAWDHAGGHYYYVIQGVVPTYTLALFKDGVGKGAFTPTPNPSSPYAWSVEYEDYSGHAFVSYHSAAQTSPVVIAERRHFKYWDGAYHDIDLTVSGQLRTIRYFQNATLIVLVDDSDQSLRFYDPISKALVGTLTLPVSAPFKIRAWTMRTWGVGPVVGGLQSPSWFSFIYEKDSITHMALYSTMGALSSWTFAASTPISTRSSGRAFLTPITIPGGRRVLYGYAGDEWFVVSDQYDGVIPYADFKDKDCTAAVKELAIISSGVARVDNFKTVLVTPRFVMGEGDSVLEIVEAPLLSLRHPISDQYRNSVQVTGQDSSGNSIDVVAGDTSSSARRLSIGSGLATTLGVAYAFAVSTAAFLVQIREQHDIKIKDPDVFLEPLDRVTYRSKDFVVFSVNYDPSTQATDLVLLEIV